MSPSPAPTSLPQNFSDRTSHQLKPSSLLHISLFLPLLLFLLLLVMSQNLLLSCLCKVHHCENTLDISMMYNYTEMHTYISFRSLVIECDKWKHISKWNWCKGMTHACKAAAQDRQLFTTAQQWEQIRILGRFVISPEDLLFLPRFAQICYSCTDLPRFVIPCKVCCSHSQLVSSGFNTKVASLPRSKAAEPSSQLLKLFNIFRLIWNSTPSIQREQQPS